MSDDAAAPVQVTKAKKTPTKAKKPKTKSAPTHPTCAVMVAKAIKEQKERNGSSLAAIKKYIAVNYKGVDVAKLSFHIKAALKRGVENKTLIQTKGSGANGRFKVSVAAKAEKPKKATKAKKVAKKPATKKSPKKTAAKKAKKPAAAKPTAKKAAAKKPAAKKPAAKKPAAKKPAAKKPAAKKAAAKK